MTMMVKLDMMNKKQSIVHEYKNIMNRRRIAMIMWLYSMQLGYYYIET